jgi:endonuclease/exonuclease/phosphatase family metal-dependent hydrolase
VQLRVCTWNIHKGIGGVDRAYRPERIHAVLAHHAPDVILLQEVDSGARRSNAHHQIDLLGDWLGYRHRAFAVNHRLARGGGYGNGVLSRYPITAAENIDVTVPHTKRRGVLHVRLRVRPPGARHARTVHLFNLHLGLAGPLRRLQLRRFLAHEPFRRLHPRTPIIVAGDLNDAWGTLGRRILVPAGFPPMARRFRTFPAVAPVRKLDALYARGDARVLSVQVSRVRRARTASDHRPLIAEVWIGNGHPRG